MQIIAHTGGVAHTNCFVIADEVAKQCVLFDAPDHTVAPLLKEIAARGWDLIGLWLTHGHFDHVADHLAVREAFSTAKVLIHKLDEPKLQNPNTRLFPLSFTIPPGKADGYVGEGDELAIGSIKLVVLHTPGHAPGHVCYHLPGQKILVGGDLIIGGAVGRTDLPDSDPRQLAKSVRRVMQLPDDTTLLGGHGDVTTLGDERANNDYVRHILAGGELD
jgi:glyoxylase-like metal-dependent hydrolase (beta-lactamase superfamily II)